MKKKQKIGFFLFFLFIVFAAAVYFFVRYHQSLLIQKQMKRGSLSLKYFHFSRAIRDFKKAEILEPDNPHIQIKYGIAFGENGKFAGSKNLLKSARIFERLRKSPDVPQKVKAHATLLLAKLLFMLGAHRFDPQHKQDVARSIFLFNQIIHQDARYKHICGNAEYWEAKLFIFEKKDFLKALPLCKKAQKNFPYLWGFCQHSIGMIHIVNKQPQKAYKNFKGMLKWLKKVWIPETVIPENSLPQVFFGRFALVDWITYDILWRSSPHHSKEIYFPKAFIPNHLKPLKKGWGERPNQVIMTLNLYMDVLKAVHWRERDHTRKALTLLLKDEKQINDLSSNPVPRYLYSDEHRRAEELKALIFAWIFEMEKESGHQKEAKIFYSKTIKASDKGLGIMRQLVREIS
jgi:tetratricopeptide (TPR) repeat protein